MPPVNIDVSADVLVGASAEELLCTDYQVPIGRYDELYAAPQQRRPHWEYVIRSLELLGASELTRREQEVRRLLRENGVTYNVYARLGSLERSWRLGPVPTLLTSREWQQIESGLIQRAELLNLILADLYGPQKLIRQGLVPPDLIYGHPGFLRPCAGSIPLKERFLVVYAADFARTADGSVCVIDDYTQAPAGAGYALENRLILSRVFPSLYRDAHVHRLALFFQTLRASLAGLTERTGSRVAVLTPGPDHETYFEHAYLAQYLDYTLVQGSDLTVRNGRVWVKTLEGLRPIDVLLRHVEDAWCDPLELHKESRLGTPGLIQAARMQQLGLANPLGCGVLENPGLMAFLPTMCRELLGQDLRLPSATTWWCGEQDACNYVLAHLDQLVIRPTVPDWRTPSVYAARLTAEARQQLAEQIRRAPHRYVGQELVPLSTTPVFLAGQLVPRPMRLRSFLVARGDGYVVMPGGLGLVAPSLDEWEDAEQVGGISKDIWVLASEPEQALHVESAGGPAVMLTRSGGEIPSRVADNLFWLGRYSERTEGGARVFRQMLLALLDTEGAEQSPYLPGLLSAVTHKAVTYLRYRNNGGGRRLVATESELLAAMCDANTSGSLRRTLDALLQTGRSVRDRLSDDAGRMLNSLDQELSSRMSLDQALESLDRVITGIASFTGLSAESMSRGQGFRFLEIGRRLERALHTISLLRTAGEMVSNERSAPWEAVLTMTDSLVTYRRRYRAAIETSAVLDLLLHDESSPRSIGYQLACLQELVEGLPHPATLPHRSPEERLSLQALTCLRTANLETLPQLDGYENLEQVLSQLSHLLISLSDTLSRIYFSHVEVQQQLMEHRHDSAPYRPPDPLRLQPDRSALPK